MYVGNYGDQVDPAEGMEVFRLLKDGSVELFASGIYGASGNEFDSKGNLLQSNVSRDRISRIAPDGSVSIFADSAMKSPVGIAIAKGDTVYVSNCNGGNIGKITPEGVSEIWVKSDLLVCPNGLTIDDDGNVYACNFDGGNIVKITPEKEVSILATLPSAGCGHLDFFEGILYVTARCANQIYSVSLDGEVSLIAGTGKRGNDDGEGKEATFNFPNGIKAIRDGDNIILIVNDVTSLEGDCFDLPLNPVLLRKITIRPK